jgi:hypothetical protein
MPIGFFNKPIVFIKFLDIGLVGMSIIRQYLAGANGR